MQVILFSLDGNMFVSPKLGTEFSGNSLPVFSRQVARLDPKVDGRAE
jgi:hypothetical protein